MTERCGVFQRKPITRKMTANIDRLKNRPLFVQEKRVAVSVQAPPTESEEWVKACDEQRARETAKKEKEAARSRANRKRRTDQKAAIKEALKTPVAEIIAREKAIKRPGSMNAGRFMTGAPTGKGELVTGGYDERKIDAVVAARSRCEGQGDEDGGFAEVDRRRIQAEGTSSAVDERELENASGSSGADNADQAAPSRFRVKLNDFDSYSMFEILFSIYFIEVPSEKTCSYVCRLCGASFEYKRWSNWVLSDLTAVGHIERVHGDESDPQHDERFGDVVSLYVKEEKKRERKQARLAKVGRKYVLERKAGFYSEAESGAREAGYVKKNGKWVHPDDAKRRVRSKLLKNNENSPYPITEGE